MKAGVLLQMELYRMGLFSVRCEQSCILSDSSLSKSSQAWSSFEVLKEKCFTLDVSTAPLEMCFIVTPMYRNQSQFLSDPRSQGSGPFNIEGRPEQEPG